MLVGYSVCVLWKDDIKSKLVGNGVYELKELHLSS